MKDCREPKKYKQRRQLPYHRDVQSIAISRIQDELAEYKLDNKRLHDELAKYKVDNERLRDELVACKIDNEILQKKVSFNTLYAESCHNSLIHFTCERNILLEIIDFMYNSKKQSNEKDSLYTCNIDKGINIILSRYPHLNSLEDDCTCMEMVYGYTLLYFTVILRIIPFYLILYLNTII